MWKDEELGSVFPTEYSFFHFKSFLFIFEKVIYTEAPYKKNCTRILDNTDKAYKKLINFFLFIRKFKSQFEAAIVETRNARELQNTIVIYITWLKTENIADYRIVIREGLLLKRFSLR